MTMTMTTRFKAAAAPVASTSHADDERCRRSKGRQAEEEEEAAKRRRKRLRFRLSLTREEIKADFEAITGKKLPSRPKRHPKAVQEKLSVSSILREMQHKSNYVLGNERATGR
ncbi:hypothetical protein OPV22_026720 [Ensete ventricosum]|uniref:TPX2 C-terminal domain-containing protein n=1 Tax=Ensete ventricosum TaxID=4639 RepID=A0AAV8PT86_ENSVE|nr:hypothetical protein OPV22_026720 [Ensete ventricosum]